jgi:hypothetical protein
MEIGIGSVEEEEEGEDCMDLMEENVRDEGLGRYAMVHTCLQRNTR